MLTFATKVPSLMFDRILNTALISQNNHFVTLFLFMSVFTSILEQLENIEIKLKNFANFYESVMFFRKALV